MSSLGFSRCSLYSRCSRKAHRSKSAVAKLNLVSLMDIFTILVFFLMVNSSEVQVLQNNKSIKLPESSAEKMPQENLVVMIDANNIIVQGRSIARISQILRQESEVISALKKELDYQSRRRGSLEPEQADIGWPVTIMGDTEVPYRLLKKVMATCSETDFRKVSLAVNRTVNDTASESRPAGV